MVSNAGWIDVDTPEDVYELRSLEPDHAPFKLVFSDEFNVPGRDFRDGHDPRWTALNKDDYTNMALHVYNVSLASTTREGWLNISTVVDDVIIEDNIMYQPKMYNQKDRTKNHNEKKERNIKHYQSGMLQGWNKFCFTGGILEVRAQLPGEHDIGGLWPAMWLLGNLARGTYVGSSDNIWPWSQESCSMKNQNKQRISGCDNVEHFGLHARQGRGSSEIDLLEAMAGPGGPLVHELFSNESASVNGSKGINTRMPYFSTSLQVAPGLSMRERPEQGTVPKFPPPGAHPNSDTHSYSKWYHEGISYGKETCLNIFFYGLNMVATGDENGIIKGSDYHADAISANTNLAKSHYESFHTYKLEWQPRSEDGSSAGYISWYLDDEFLFRVDGEALELAGGPREAADGSDQFGERMVPPGAIIPQEPMYVLLNTAVSATWGFPEPCPTGCAACPGAPNSGMSGDDDGADDEMSSESTELYMDENDANGCFDCRKARCSCSMPAKMCENFPASFLIDYVRVYQWDDSGFDKDDDVYKARHFAAEPLGCSTPSHPSDVYIEANAHLYKSEHDDVPLRDVQRGGGSCVVIPVTQAESENETADISVIQPSDAGEISYRDRCGGPKRGECVHRSGITGFFLSHEPTCVCKEGFTGPNCLSTVGFDDIDYVQIEKTRNSLTNPDNRYGIQVPLSLILYLVTALFLLGLLVYLVRKEMSKARQTCDDTDESEGLVSHLESAREASERIETSSLTYGTDASYGIFNVNASGDIEMITS